MSAIDKIISQTTIGMEAASKKEEYIDEIVMLLKNCNKESVFQYIKSFLEKVA